MQTLNHATKQPNKLFTTITRTFLISLLLGALICLDFILYLRAGNVFVTGGINIPVLMAIGAIFVVSFVLMTVTFFSRFLQSIVFSLCGVLLVIGLMNQFLQIDKSQYLMVLLSSLIGDVSIFSVIEGYADWVLFGFIFLFVYIIISKMENKSLATCAIIVLISVGLFTFSAMTGKKAKAVTEDIYKSTETNFNTQNNKTVFLFMPNANSFVGLSDKNEKDKMLKNMALGFFAKHGFQVYPHAYVKYPSRYANLVETLNILDTKNYQDHLMNNVAMENLWKFNTTQKPEVFLVNNQMLNVYKKAHYKVNAFQTKRMEICKVNNQFSSDLCMQNVSGPFDIKEFSDMDRTYLLLAQWGSTFDVLFSPSIMSSVQMFIDRAVLQKIAMPYDQIHVVNSFQTLQRVLDTINEDSSVAGVYFVYLDFPNNLFVFDEKCKLKPYREWSTDNPKIKSSAFSQNAGGYADQMICFWNKMEEFMQNLIKLDASNNLTLVINGISSGGENSATSINFIEQFKQNDLVLFAIREPSAKFKVNNRICSIKDFLRSYLFNTSLCKEFSGLAIAPASAEHIQSNLLENKLKKNEVVDALNFYNKKIKELTTGDSKLNIVKDVVKKEAPQPRKKEVSEDEVLSDDAVRMLMGDTPVVSNNKPAEASKQDIEDDINNTEEKDETEKQELEDVPLEQPSKINEDVVSSEKEVPVAENDDNNIITEEKSTVENEKIENSPNVEAIPSEENVKLPEVETNNVVEETKDSETSSSDETLSVTQHNEIAPKNGDDIEVVFEVIDTDKKTSVITTENDNSYDAQQEVAPELNKIIDKQEVGNQNSGNIQEVDTVISLKEVRAQEAAPDLNKIIIERDPNPQQISSVANESANEDVVIHSEIHTDLSGDFLFVEEGEDWEIDPAKALGVSGDESEQQKIIIKEQ